MVSTRSFGPTLFTLSPSTPSTRLPVYGYLGNRPEPCNLLPGKPVAQELCWRRNRCEERIPHGLASSWSTSLTRAEELKSSLGDPDMDPAGCIRPRGDAGMLILQLSSKRKVAYVPLPMCGRTMA
ncbi:hypothetical protein VTK56DRAFT_1569 [Thermocarpiscus australiensis]